MRGLLVSVAADAWQQAFKDGAGAGNKRRLRKLVETGPPPGLLGYLGEEPVAWCGDGAA